MLIFEFAYKKQSTGRINRAVRYAMSEGSHREVLAHDSDIGEILSCEQRKPLPATDAQINYLKDLMRSIPSGINVTEASDLIDNAKEKREPGSFLDRQLAQRFGVEFSRYTSKAKIFTFITHKVKQNKDPLDLAIWFVYRVYRDGFDRNSSMPISEPDDDRLRAIAVDLTKTPYDVNILREAAEYSSKGFRWFGDLVNADGSIIYGDDDESQAYKMVASKLENAGLIDRKSRNRRRENVEFNGGQRAENKSDVSLRKVSLYLGFGILMLWYLLG
jgi:hypothetical protein